MTFLPVPEFRPDTAYLKSDYSDEVQNVFAADGFYMPCPSFTKFVGLNVPYTTYGAIGVRTLSNSVIVFIGTSKNLWMLQDPSEGFVCVSQGYVSPTEDPYISPFPKFLYNGLDGLNTRADEDEQGPYSAGPNNRWFFTTFGNTVIAVNGVDPPQILDYTNASPETSRFRDLGAKIVNPSYNPDEPVSSTNRTHIPGTWEQYWAPAQPPSDEPPDWNNNGTVGINMPPYGSVVKNWGNFVALMDIRTSSESSSIEGNSIAWSGLNNPDWWVIGYMSCDIQTFYDGGRVVGSSEATNPIIFLQTAIYAATFVPGSDIIFSFQKVHERRGLKSALSLASRGALSFYADEGGFFQINGDGAITPIGFEKVDRTYFSSINSQNLAQIMGVIDPFYTRVYWALDTEAKGIFDEILVYDWQLQKWTSLKVTVVSLIPVYSFGVTLEGLDAFCKATPDGPSQIELLPYSLDSKVWQSGSPILMGLGIDEQNNPYIGSFNGDSMEASVVSQEMGPTNRLMMRINGVMPVVDNENVLISAGRRNIANLSTPIDWTPERRQSVNTGFVHLRSRARYHRFRMRIEEGEAWSNMTGIDVTAIPAGIR